MKAKCPHCQDGCDKCDGGFLEVSLALGELYTRHCNSCGFDNGGMVVEPTAPTLTGKPSPCVRCESVDMAWLLVTEDPEVTTCPYRATHGTAGRQGPDQDTWHGGDQWQEFPWSWKPRTCSFCGGVHPEDVLRLVLEGWEDEMSLKPYKGYLHPPGYQQSMDGALLKMDKGMDPIAALRQRPSVNSPKPPAKFYVKHFTASQLAELNDKRSSKPS